MRSASIRGDPTSTESARPDGRRTPRRPWADPAPTPPRLAATVGTVAATASACDHRRVNQLAALATKTSALGMGTTFILFSMGFVVIFVAMVMIGEQRNKNKPRQEPIRTPVLRAKDAERERRAREQGKFDGQ